MQMIDSVKTYQSKTFATEKGNGALPSKLVQQEALASYELSKSRGNRARGLELLDQLDAHFQSTS